MPKNAEPEYDFSGFDDAFASLTPEKREEANRAILRYLELVLFIAQQAESLTPIELPRTISLSGRLRNQST